MSIREVFSIFNKKEKEYVHFANKTAGLQKAEACGFCGRDQYAADMSL